jgi:hypothetical protein
MANDMFTKRDGTQVPVPVITIPFDIVMSAMRAQEDYLSKGKQYRLSTILLDWLITGKNTLAKRAQNAIKNRDNKNAGKAVKEYIRIQLQLRKPIDPLVVAELSGIQMPEIDSIEDTIEGDGTLDLTDEQLEAATNPQGHVA